MDHRDVLAAVAAAGEFEGVADRPLDTHPGVHRPLRRHLVERPLAQESTVADVRALGVLPDHDEVVRLRVAGRGPLERPLVDVQVEGDPHPDDQPAFEDARGDVGPAGRAEQDRVVVAELLDRRLAQHLAVAQVPPAAEVEVGGVDVGAGRAEHLEGLGGDLRTDPVATDHRDAMRHSVVLPFCAATSARTSSPCSSSSGGPPVDARLRAGELDRRVGVHRRPLAARCLERDEHLARRQVRIVEQHLVVVHRSDRAPGPRALRAPRRWSARASHPSMISSTIARFLLRARLSRVRSSSIRSGRSITSHRIGQ